MTIRTLIVDDEPLARLNLSSLLEDEPDFQVFGECADVPAALAALRSAPPALMFLDVQMPGLSGLDLLAALPPAAVPALVFVTAHEQFALKAFDACAVDYLLKPFRRDRFQLTLQRVRARLALAADAPQRLLVKSGGRFVFVELGELERVSAAANYVTLHAGSAVHAVRETMNEFEQRLPAARFVRIHRGHIVARQALSALEPAGDGEYIVRLRSGRELPVGPRYADALRSRLAALPLLRMGSSRALG